MPARKRRLATFTISGLMAVIALAALLAFWLKPQPKPEPRFTTHIGAFW